MGVAGGLADAEALACLKDLLHSYNSDHLYTEERFATRGAGSDLRSNYLLNAGIEGIERADLVILVGTNPRYEAPLINARLRKAFVHNDLRVALLGTQVDLTYDYDYLGDSVEDLQALATGKHPFSKALAAAKRPMIVVGSPAMQRGDADTILSLAIKISVGASAEADWNVLNVLHRRAGQVAALDLGYRAGVPAEAATKAKFVFLLGSDAPPKELLDDAFVVYQGRALEQPGFCHLVCCLSGIAHIPHRVGLLLFFVFS